EGAIYNSPRSMLTHSRTFMEALLERVMVYERMESNPYLSIIERIQELDEDGLLTEEVRNALHEVRKLGNVASHDVRQFRYSESLITWEHLYTIVKWYVEVIGSIEIEVPAYVDPVIKPETSYNLEEMNIRFEKMERLLKQSMKAGDHKGQNTQGESSATLEQEIMGDNQVVTMENTSKANSAVF